MPALFVTASVILGIFAAMIGFVFFFNTPDSRLFPGILVPSAALALGSFLAAYSLRSARAAGFALVPALSLPVLMSIWLMVEGRSINGWPVVAAGACIIAFVAGWAGRVASGQRNLRGSDQNET